VSSFEKVLVSAVNDWSGDITEGKKVSDWIQIGVWLMRYGHLGIYFCRDQDMKVFFRG
jgi:hypothetical protein